MMRSLWTAASGMTGQQFNIDTISNNLANVNTTGFKQMRADFEDLLYQTQKLAGTPATEATVVPDRRPGGSRREAAARPSEIFTQGALQATGNTRDMAIEGDGFFRVMQYDGTYAYTRDGSFKIDSNGQLVTSDGYKLIPEVILPEGFIHDSLAISQDGRDHREGRRQRRSHRGRPAGALPLRESRGPRGHRAEPPQGHQRLGRPHRGTPRIRRHGQESSRSSWRCPTSPSSGRW